MPLTISSNGLKGTTRYFDDPERPQAATSEHAGLKCDTSGPVPIILVPQPSDDPNDPLVRVLEARHTLLLIEICRIGLYGSEIAFFLSSLWSQSSLRLWGPSSLRTR
jgi:hypothetical protein